ncbi:MAG: N-acetylmuramoyl-L-alanine amidase-like domain-containing protein, partial [Gemmatimonadota bacterium]
MRGVIRFVAVAAAVVGAVVFSRGSAGQDESGVSPEAGVASDAGPSTAAGPAPEPGGVSGGWSTRDREIFEATVRWADAEGLAALEPGAAIGRLAESFVGTPYTPGTLEADGPEGLVINFREFDCVTFVENMLAMTRFIRDGGA